MKELEIWFQKKNDLIINIKNNSNNVLSFQQTTNAF